MAVFLQRMLVKELMAEKGRNTMERIPVKSSNIASVGYDEGNKTLEIQFKSGAVYQYSGVEPQTHADLMAAESVGKFVQQNIVKAEFKGQRVDPEQKSE